MSVSCFLFNLVEFDTIVSHTMLTNPVEDLGDKEIHPDDKHLTFVCIEGQKGPLKFKSP